MALTTTGTSDRITSASTVLMTAVASRPRPAAMPMAAVSHMPAAVVRPRTRSSSSLFKMLPAHRKPMPATTPWITRLRSAGTMPACCGISTNRAAPMATSMWVRTPAALPLFSRSRPSRPPSSAANIRRSTMRVACARSGTSENSEATVWPMTCHQGMSMLCTLALRAGHGWVRAGTHRAGPRCPCGPSMIAAGRSGWPRTWWRWTPPSSRSRVFH